MAGIIAVYGLVVAVLIAGDLGPPPETQYSLYAYVELSTLHEQKRRKNTDFGDSGCLHLAAGLSVGLAGLAAGYTIGIVGEAVSCADIASTIQPLLNGYLGNACLHATIQSLCRYGFDIDFRRSPGSIRVSLSTSAFYNLTNPLHRLIVGLILNSKSSA